MLSTYLRTTLLTYNKMPTASLESSIYVVTGIFYKNHLIEYILLLASTY